MVRRVLWTGLLCLALPAAARAQAGVCEGLDDDEQATIKQLFGKLHSYGCCEDTLERCLSAKPPCAQTLRVADALCRMARLGSDRAALEEAFTRRKQSMVATDPPATIALQGLEPAGDPKSPVTAVLYLCSRCPFCRDVALRLYGEVTDGDLKGKVRLYFKPFPLKDHEGAVEGDTALAAAARLGKAWPFAVFLFRHFNEFHPAVLPDWAESVGLRRADFEKAFADDASRQALAESKKEGLRNKVEATPTLFIDGRRWTGGGDASLLVDALLEESERLASSTPKR